MRTPTHRSCLKAGVAFWHVGPRTRSLRRRLPDWPHRSSAARSDRCGAAGRAERGVKLRDKRAGGIAHHVDDVPPPCRRRARVCLSEGAALLPHVRALRWVTLRQRASAPPARSVCLRCFCRRRFSSFRCFLPSARSLLATADATTPESAHLLPASSHAGGCSSFAQLLVLLCTFHRGRLALAAFALAFACCRRRACRMSARAV
jgi:hypothetical protein